MGCLVKACIQGNKKGFWSDTISVQAEQLKAENRKITVKNHKKSFFSSGFDLPKLDSSQGSKMEYPRGFLFYKPILSQVGTWSFLRFCVFHQNATAPPGGHIWNQMRWQIEVCTKVY